MIYACKVLKKKPMPVADISSKKSISHTFHLCSTIVLHLKEYEAFPLPYPILDQNREEKGLNHYRLLLFLHNGKQILPLLLHPVVPQGLQRYTSDPFLQHQM